MLKTFVGKIVLLLFICLPMFGQIYTYPGSSIGAIPPAPPTPPEEQSAAPGLLSLPVRELGANQVTNPDFESDFTGWTGGDASHTIETTDCIGSGKCAKVIMPDGVVGLKFDPGTTVVGLYTVSGWIKTDNISTGAGDGVRFCFEGNFPWSEGRQCTDLVNGTTPWTFYEISDVYISATCAACGISFQDNSSPTGTAWIDNVSIKLQQDPVLSVFLKQPNYRGMLFDDMPEQLVFDAQLRDDPASHTIRINVVDESDESVDYTDDFVAEDGEIILPLAAIPNDKSYIVTVELRDAALDLVYTAPTYRLLTKAASVRNAMSLAYDEDNYFVRDGSRIFLTGVYDHGVGFTTSEAQWTSLYTDHRRIFEADSVFDVLLDYGQFNTFHTNLVGLLDALDTDNKVFWQNCNCFQDGWGAATTQMQCHIDGFDPETHVGTIAPHHGNGGYYLMDECLANMITPVFQQTLNLRELDPDGILFGASTSPAQIPFWRDVLDVLSTDPYPITGAGPYDLGQVADWTQLAKDGMLDSRPVVTVIQYFDWVNPAVYPTYQELRDMSLMAVAKGANGLMYWSIGNGQGSLATLCASSTTWCQTRIDKWQELKDIVSELKDFEVELTLDDDLDEVIDADGVTIRAKRSGDVVTLIVSNETNAQVTPTIELATTIASVVIASGGSLTPTGATFTPTLEAYEGEIYTVTYSLLDEVNLVGWYKFDDASGETLIDSAGTANNGQLGPTAGADSNQPTWTTAGGHNVLDFTGVTNSWVELGNPAELQVQTGDHTIFAVVSCDATGNSILTKGESRGATNTREWDLFNNGSGSNSYVMLSAGGTVRLNLTTTAFACDGSWHIITVGWDGTTGANGAFIQVDGNTAATGTVSVADIANVKNWFIGGSGSTGFVHDGKIAEVLIYSSLKDASERTAIRDALKATHGGLSLP